jgi:hypothetical protein
MLKINCGSFTSGRIEFDCSNKTPEGMDRFAKVSTSISFKLKGRKNLLTPHSNCVYPYSSFVVQS